MLYLLRKDIIAMKTRVDKYTEEEMNLPPRRVSKNTNLYEEIKGEIHG